MRLTAIATDCTLLTNTQFFARRMFLDPIDLGDILKGGGMDNIPPGSSQVIILFEKD
jgi:hypothetical protein